MVGRTGFCLTFCLLATCPAWAGDSQWVLLRNGSVLRGEGEVRLIGDRYLVTAEGSEIRLRAESVHLVEDSLLAVYERLANEPAEPTINDRLRLAEWCQRQKLWSQAMRQLLAAQREAPKSHAVAAAQRRLWLAREREIANDQAPGRPDGRVQPAGYDEPLPASAASSEASSEASPGLTLAAPLPEGTLSAFTRRVQPILVNNCTIAGCHAVGGSEAFQLNRDLLHGLASRRSTDANLAAVLAAIDAADPAASPLLRAMQPSHAGGRGARLGVHRERLVATVADWVALVAGAEPAAPGPVEPPAAVAASAPVKGAGTPAPEDRFKPGYYEKLRDASGEAPPPAPRRGASLKRQEPRDEFDPEIFNRRYVDGADAP